MKTESYRLHIQFALYYRELINIELKKLYPCSISVEKYRYGLYMNLMYAKRERDMQKELERKRKELEF